jgi:site-specific DNA recombinase
MAEDTLRVGVYARISRDRDGESTATDRQIADCRAFAQARGWQVAGVYEDRDLSAWKVGTPRPEYERLLDDVRGGAVQVILAWKIDRLLRRPKDFEAVWSICEAEGAHIATVKDSIDTTQPFVGKLLPRLMTIFAEMESENISVREKSKAAASARNGQRHGGGRAFGFNDDWTALEPIQAELIREATSRLLSGESLRGIVADWQRRDVRSVKGKPWTSQALRYLLLSPRIAGHRAHLGSIAARNAFPAIVDDATWRRVVAILRDNSRTKRGAGVPARRYLLSGFMVCGLCGKAMYGRGHGQGIRRYQCLNDPGRGGCGRLSVRAEPVEALLTEAVLYRLDGPALQKMLLARRERTDASADVEALQADEAALEQASRDFYAERILNRAEFLAVRQTLEARIAGARGRLAESNGHGMLARLAGSGEPAREQWERGDLLWRRALLGAVLDEVRIGPGAGGGVFNPDRVSLGWRA